MKALFQKLVDKSKKKQKDQETTGSVTKADRQSLNLQVSALYTLLNEMHGSDDLVMKAGKLDALHLMRSSVLEERVLALERLIYEDPTIDEQPELEEIPNVLDDLESDLADQLARRTVEDEIERKVSLKLQERHQEYVKDIRTQLIKEESGPDNAQTLKKYAELEILEQRQLSRSAVEMMRPKNLEGVVGQQQGIKALLSKLSSPFPQHILVYGPPGVGKTTVARLALQEAIKREYTPFSQEAPFVEVDGTTLRWDPREVTNPLLGSVHDPIYQGAKRELVDGGVPEPKLGLVTESHGGVLFIDEIGELESVLQNKLLKVLEDKRVLFESSYYDPDDPQVPKYIKKLFSEGAPADFILVGATTKDPSQINPALRSRCAEVFFDPLTPTDIEQIIIQAAKRLQVELEPKVASIISDYTIDGRQATRLLADAYSVALYRSNEGDADKIAITGADAAEVIRSSRLTAYTTQKASDKQEIGRIFGLGVSGFLGSVLEIEAVAFPSKAGKGQIRFNETAGSMAKDSVFNAASVFRRITGEELNNYDVHVNIVGGGQIDGPSAGVAILLTIISAVRGLPIPQNIAVTGEVSLQGKVKAIGGIHSKVYGARQAGIKQMFIPQENREELTEKITGIEVTAVSNVEEIIAFVFPGEFCKNLVSLKPALHG